MRLFQKDKRDEYEAMRSYEVIYLGKRFPGSQHDPYVLKLLPWEVIVPNPDPRRRLKIMEYERFPTEWEMETKENRKGDKIAIRWERIVKPWAAW